MRGQFRSVFVMNRVRCWSAVRTAGENICCYFVPFGVLTNDNVVWAVDIRPLPKPSWSDSWKLLICQLGGVSGRQVNGAGSGRAEDAGWRPWRQRAAHCRRLDVQVSVKTWRTSSVAEEESDWKEPRWSSDVHLCRLTDPWRHQPCFRRWRQVNCCRLTYLFIYLYSFAFPLLEHCRYTQPDLARSQTCHLILQVSQRPWRYSTITGVFWRKIYKNRVQPELPGSC